TPNRGSSRTCWPQIKYSPDHPIEQVFGKLKRSRPDNGTASNPAAVEHVGRRWSHLLCRAQNCFYRIQNERLTVSNAIISQFFCILDQSMYVKRGIAALTIMVATHPRLDFFCSCKFVTQQFPAREF